MSKSLMDTFNTVKATAKDLQSQMERMSSTFSTLSNQMQALEKSIKSSDSAGSKRSYSDDGTSQTPEKKMKGSTAEASGWTGKEFSDPDAPSVYTDGCCFHNGKKGAVGGIGVYWGPGHKDNVSDKLTGKPTNNRAEIHAAMKAVRQAKEKGIFNLVIHTDSEFLINSITKWIKGWKKKDWRTAAGGPVANKEDFQDLDEALKGINVKWIHVRGHQGIPGNEAADRLANEGARKQ